MVTKLGAGTTVGDLAVFDGTSWIVLASNATATRKFLTSLSTANSWAVVVTVAAAEPAPMYAGQVWVDTS